MSEHETNFVCSDMQKRLFPSNSLQTRVLPIEQRTVALILERYPRTLMRGVGGVGPPRGGGSGGSHPELTLNKVEMYVYLLFG